MYTKPDLTNVAEYIDDMLDTFPDRPKLLQLYREAYGDIRDVTTKRYKRPPGEDEIDFYLAVGQIEALLTLMGFIGGTSEFPRLSADAICQHIMKDDLNGAWPHAVVIQGNYIVWEALDDVTEAYLRVLNLKAGVPNA